MQSPSSTRSSLEYGTKLDEPSMGSWGFVLYPEAAEGGGSFVGFRIIADAWGHGFVHIKLLGDLPTGSGVLGEARLASRYLSKYIGKDLGTGEAAGLHRYEVAQGFQPRSIALDGTTAEG